MQQHPDMKVQHESDTSLHLAGSQGWHYGIKDNFLSSNLLPRSTSSVTSLNQLNFCQFSGQISEVPASVGKQEHGSVASSVVSPKMGEFFVQETHRDQIYPELHGVPHYGTTPPFLLSKEPVYVNAKQYHAILRRRQLRAKAEIENKLTRVRKPYLHESRHLHALRRARGCGGRFINTKKPASAGKATDEEGNSMGDSPPILNNFSSEPDHSVRSSTVSSGIVEPSSSFEDFSRLSLQGTNHAEYSFLWSCHKSCISK